jgi:tetratricopeptide (TPR) repeat protein
MFRLQTGDWGAAVADCDTVIKAGAATAVAEATPLYKKALFRRAQARQGLGGAGDLAKAEADLRELVALEPSNTPAIAALTKVDEAIKAAAAAAASAKASAAQKQEEKESAAAAAQAAAAATQQAAPPPVAPPAPISIASTTATKSSASPTSSPGSQRGSSSCSPSASRSPSAVKKLDPVAVAQRLKARPKKAPLDLPKTGYEFERVFRSLASDPSAFCAYLQAVKPGSYKRLFKQGIEADLAAGVIANLRSTMLAVNHAHALKTLGGMLKIPRFATIIGFFGPAEKSDLTQIFAQLEAGGGDPEKVAATKEKYRL